MKTPLTSPRAEGFMIVCSCNALSHTDIEAAIGAGASRPAEIYAARKCRAQCGNCVPGMLCLLRHALNVAAMEALPTAASPSSAHA